MSNVTDRYRAEILHEYRYRQIRGFGPQGTVTAGDGFNQIGG